MAYNAGKNLTKLCVEEKSYITGGFVKENSYPNQIIHTSPPPPPQRSNVRPSMKWQLGSNLLRRSLTLVVLYARRLFRRVRSVYYNSTVEPTLSDHPKILRFASFCWLLRRGSRYGTLRQKSVRHFWWVVSSNPNGLWVNSPWRQRPNELLTQRPWRREE